MKSSLPICAALLAGGLVSTDVNPAKAGPLLPPELDQALLFIKDGLRPFQTAEAVIGVLEFLNIIGGDGIDLAQKLDQVESRLIEEIQFWMNVQLDAAVTAAFTKYQDVLRNPGQTSLNRERILFLTGSSSSNDAGDVFAELERLIWDGGDVERAIRLTTPFNALSVMMGQAMIFHDRYFPEEAPFSWLTFNDHYGRTFRADYQLVKVSTIQCYPGFNPALEDIVTEHSSVFESSSLYRKRENRFIEVGTASCLSGAAARLSYNPVTNQFRNTCPPAIPQIMTSVVINGQTFPAFNAAAQTAARTRGRSLAQSHFRTADDVDALRESMRELRFMSGGDQGNNILGDLNEGEFFDPWVYESTLCPAAAPWAYVRNP
jgi:hypothetical protein